MNKDAAVQALLDEKLGGGQWELVRWHRTRGPLEPYVDDGGWYWAVEAMDDTGAPDLIGRGRTPAAAMADAANEVEGWATCTQPLPGPYPLYGCLLHDGHPGPHKVRPVKEDK